jgi:hypothetical protein
LYSCLPPTGIIPPIYVSSTTTDLVLKWSTPRYLNGCPLQGYELMMGVGAVGAILTLHASYNPGETIAFTVLDTSNIYRF